MAKRHFLKNRPQMSDVFRDVTEGPVHVLSMADNENLTISWKHLSIVLQT